MPKISNFSIQNHQSSALPNIKKGLSKSDEFLLKIFTRIELGLENEKKSKIEYPTTNFLSTPVNYKETSVSLPCLHQKISKNIKNEHAFIEILKKFNKYINSTSENENYEHCDSCDIPSFATIRRKDVEPFSLFFVKNANNNLIRRFEIIASLGAQVFEYLIQESISTFKINLFQQLKLTGLREKINKITSKDWDEWSTKYNKKLENIKTIMLLPDETDEFDLKYYRESQNNHPVVKLIPTKNLSSISSLKFSYEPEKISCISTKYPKLQLRLSIKKSSIDLILFINQFFSSPNITTKTIKNHIIIITETSQPSNNQSKKPFLFPHFQRFTHIFNISHYVPLKIITSLLHGCTSADFSGFTNYHLRKAESLKLEKIVKNQKKQQETKETSEQSKNPYIKLSEKEGESKLIESSSSSISLSSSSSSALGQILRKNLPSSSLSIPSPSKNIEQESKENDEEIELENLSSLTSPSTQTPIKARLSFGLNVPSPSLLGSSRSSSIPRPSNLSIKGVEVEVEIEIDVAKEPSKEESESYVL